MRAAGRSALAICAIITVVDGCEWVTTRSAFAQQVPGQTVSTSGDHQQQSRSDAGNAGLPVMPEYNGTAVKPPSAKELDRREQILAAPRREAGPPLRAGAPNAASGRPQPPPTDPTQ
jgi:hypothetical protein